MADAQRKVRSPYQRYGKVPYRYSDAYHQWAANPNPTTSARHTAYIERLHGELPGLALERKRGARAH